MKCPKCGKDVCACILEDVEEDEDYEDWEDDEDGE